MKRTVQVHMGDPPRLVGVLRHEALGARESAAFAYEPSWLGSADRFALDPTLPLVSGPQFHRRQREGSLFHPAIADTEPDGWGRRVILRDHAKQRQAARERGATQAAAHLNALDFLLAVDDTSRVGALRYCDEHGVFRRAPEPGTRGVPPLIELGHLVAASRAVEEGNDTAADLAYLRGRGTSLGGLRPKCTVVDDDGCLSIGKFPSVGDGRAVTKGEVLALHLASAAGIRAAAARIIDSDGVPVALIRRFDRGGFGRREMYVSAATMLGVDARDPMEHAYTEIVDALRVHGAEPQADMEELWRRMALSILITNIDDHLLNHGFLYAGNGRWRLSPAFDLNPFPERARELKTWISEDAGPSATIDALVSVCPYFRLPPRRAAEILGDVERAVARWRDLGGGLGMSKAELDPFENAFEHEERNAARAWIARHGA